MARPNQKFHCDNFVFFIEMIGHSVKKNQGSSEVYKEIKMESTNDYTQVREH